LCKIAAFWGILGDTFPSLWLRQWLSYRCDCV